MRLIDADAMNEELFYKQLGGKDTLITAECAFNMINEQPTVEAKPVVHGEWIRQKNSMGSWTHPTYKCNICGSGTNNDNKYCSECGASMEQWVYGKSKWE